MTADERALLAWWLVHPVDALTATIQPDHFSTLPGRRLALTVQRKGWTLGDAHAALVSDSDPTGIATHTELVDLSRGFVQAQAVASADRVRQRFAAKVAETSATTFLTRLRGKGAPDVAALIRELVSDLAEAEAMAPILSRTHAEVAREVMTDWFESIRDPDKVRTLPMPWPGIHAHTGGWAIGKLHFVGGRSSEHKTTFARASAAHLASLGIRCTFYTAEDSDADISGRTLAEGSRLLDTRALMLGRLPEDKGGITEDQLARIMADVEASITGPIGANLRILDAPNPTLGTVLSTIKTEVAKGARAFFFDFAQLIRPDSGLATNDWWRFCIAQLTGLAKQLQIPIIATSQIEKTGTQASAAEGRVPRADEMPFGAVMRQGAFACVMVGSVVSEKTGRKLLIAEVEKWKSAENVGANKENATFHFDVEPAHDRLIERTKS